MLSFFKGIEYTIFLIMKQKTKFKNFGNIGIGYRSVNVQYISIIPQKSHIGRSLDQSLYIIED